MVENRPFLNFLSHLVLILGVLVVAFPIWVTFVAASHDGVRMTQGWATLGDYDVVAVIDAPDAKTAAQVSALIASKGNFRAKTLSAVPIADLSDLVEDGD